MPEASFEYGRDRPHCWMGESATRPGQPKDWPEVITMLARYVASHAPAGIVTQLDDMVS